MHIVYDISPDPLIVLASVLGLDTLFQRAGELYPVSGRDIQAEAVNKICQIDLPNRIQKAITLAGRGMNDVSAVQHLLHELGYDYISEIREPVYSVETHFTTEQYASVPYELE